MNKISELVTPPPLFTNPPPCSREYQSLFSPWPGANSELDRFEALVKRITYKPDYKIKVEREASWDHSGILFISARVPDATKRNSGMIDVHLGTAIPLSFDDDDHRLRFIRHCLSVLEQHEIDEFFQLDGRCVNAPHPNR